MRTIQPEQLNRIHSLLDSQRHSHREIASIVGVHPSTVSRIRIRDRPSLLSRAVGRPPKLNDTNLRYGIRLMKSGKVDSTKELAKELSELTNESISVRTVRRQLRKAGMEGTKVIRRPKTRTIVGKAVKKSIRSKKASKQTAKKTKSTHSRWQWVRVSRRA